MHFGSSKHSKVRRLQPWHRLQFEHIRPSPHTPYLWCLPPQTSPGPLVQILFPQGSETIKIQLIDKVHHMIEQLGKKFEDMFFD